MKQGGRKFWLAVGFTVAVILLLLVGKIDQPGFIELAKFALGGYLGVNVLHRAVEAGLSVAINRKEEPKP
jgi:hypothetical protein